MSASRPQLNIRFSESDRTLVERFKKLAQEHGGVTEVLTQFIRECVESNFIDTSRRQLDAELDTELDTELDKLDADLDARLDAKIDVRLDAIMAGRIDRAIAERLKSIAPVPLALPPSSEFRQKPDVVRLEQPEEPPDASELLSRDDIDRMKISGLSKSTLKRLERDYPSEAERRLRSHGLERFETPGRHLYRRVPEQKS